jgi:hypothetical protein
MPAASRANIEAFLDAGVVHRYYNRSIKMLFAETFMDCPVCKNAMITLELQDVEVDHCTMCGGIWLVAIVARLVIHWRGAKVGKVADSPR